MQPEQPTNERNDLDPQPAETSGGPTKTEGEHWLSILTGRWMLGIGVILFALSLFLQILFHFYETPSANGGNRRSLVAVSRDTLPEWVLSFMRELGAVLVVSYLIRELIEKGQQKVWHDALSRRVEEILFPTVKQVKELNVDLGITLRNSLVFHNEDARKELTEKVLRPDFVRRSYVLTLTLEGSPDEPHVKVTTDTNYILENVADAARPYSIRGWIDIVPDAWVSQNEQSRFTFLAFGPAELRDQDSHRPFDAAQLCDPKIVKRSELVLELEYPIKPDIPKNGKYFSQLTAVQYMRCREQFIWNMAYVTERLDVVVKLGGKLTWKNFAVSPRAMHHGSKFDQVPPETAASDQEPRTWTITGVLLPNQGVQVWWSPQASAVTPAPNTPPLSSSTAPVAPQPGGEA